MYLEQVRHVVRFFIINLQRYLILKQTKKHLDSKMPKFKNNSFSIHVLKPDQI